MWRTPLKGVDKTCLVPIMGFVLKKVGPYWIFLRKRMAMAFEDDIIFPSFLEDGEGEEESDPLEDDELEGDETKETDADEDLDDDFGIEEEK